MIKHYLFILMLLLLQGLPAVASAAEEANAKAMEKMMGDLSSISHDIESGRFTGDDLQEWTKTTIKMGSQASLCVANKERASGDLKVLIESLGDRVDGEDDGVTSKRNILTKQKEDIDRDLARCNLYVTTSAEVSKLITEAEKSYFKQKYLARSPHMVDLIAIFLENPFDLFIKSGSFIFEHSGISEIGLTGTVLGAAAVVMAVVFGYWLRRRLREVEKRRIWREQFTADMLRAMLTTTASSAPYFMGSGAALLTAVIIHYEVVQIPFIMQLTIGLLIYFSTIWMIRLLFSPSPPAELFVTFSPAVAGSLSLRLRTLAVLGLVGYLAFYTVFSQSIIESHLLLLRNIFSLFVVVNIVWTLKVIISSPRLPKLRYISIFVILVVVASLVAEWLGYRNLAYISRQVILLTFITLMVFIGIAKIFRDLYDAIDNGTYPWCRSIHKTLGVDKGNRVPGLIWIRLTTSILIWGTFAFMVINAWGYSGGLIEQIRGYIINGFDIGDFRIVPGRILWALLLFGGVIILSSWLRSQLENNWLKMTNMDSGARDALVTIIGYIMFMIAFLLGLSAAGFDFSNLAIIAGALSVGIGFGLQNIVNNFVSGLILLFERPIRKGDWVVVGNTEGYVRDIQIRSTRIQTFDRSDVIVPNSELISNQVTNWVLTNRSGRAIMPVGVAYGSDTEKVRDILLEIARNHPDVDNSGLAPEPKVLFREFGDSSLNFELRVFLRDIDSRLSVISDINFAVDKAFREEDIEIPFPQRDIHVRDVPAKEMSVSGSAEKLPGKITEKDDNNNK